MLLQFIILKHELIFLNFINLELQQMVFLHYYINYYFIIIIKELIINKFIIKEVIIIIKEFKMIIK